MKKESAKTREITFFSKKNGKTISVCSSMARMIAEALERDAGVMSYEVNVPLGSLLHEISPIGIRDGYIRENWTTDFIVCMLDGTTLVIETVSEQGLMKKAVMEQLEISRRFWEKKRAESWKIAVVKGENKLGKIF